MNFTSWAALAVGLLIAAPIAAHLLQRGRTPIRDFPAVSLLSRKIAHSRERAKLRDQAILWLRVAMILMLAALGATPLVQCSDLSLERPVGESIALAIVLDDSHSMRALTPSGKSRWEVARTGAMQLIGSLREGDSVTISLAGYPARLALAPMSNRSLAEESLKNLSISDRHSNLEDAIKLAQAALEPLRQPSHRVVVFSDLAGSTISLNGNAAPVLTPLEQLRQPINDCGLTSASRTDTRLRVRVTCSATASGERTLSLVSSKAPYKALVPPNPSQVDPSPLEDLSRLLIVPQVGTQTLSVALPVDYPPFSVTLAPADDNPANDRTDVSEVEQGLLVAIASEPTQSGILTGGATLLERAVHAVSPNVSVRPLTELPTESAALQPFAAILVDDPAGLSPDARRALTEWIELGGVALGLLGPATNRLALAASLEPFAERSARWSPLSQSMGLDPESLTTLGTQAESLRSLAPRGRVHLAGSLAPSTEVLGQWQDGSPFLVSRNLGVGLVLTTGLSTSLAESNFALRPGFLSLIELVLERAAERRGPSSSPVGALWRFSGAEDLSIVGSTGSLEITTAPCPAGSNCTATLRYASPDRAGRYEVRRAERVQSRMAKLAASEITDLPGSPLAAPLSANTTATSGSVDASAHASLILLLLFALELAARTLRQATRKNGQTLLT